MTKLNTKRRPAGRAGEAGFTLVELMVVIVIIGLLATIVAINVLPSLGKANTQKAKADIEVLDQAVTQYRLDTMQYPPAGEGLRALAAKSSGGQSYIRKLPNDPWGRPYVYRLPGEHGAYDILSLGADGQPGGEGENADIGNW